MCHFDNFFGNNDQGQSLKARKNVYRFFFFGFGERERVNIPCRILIKETVFHALMCPLQTLLLLDKTEKNQTKDSQAQTSSASQRNKNGANM